MRNLLIKIEKIINYIHVKIKIKIKNVFILN